MGASKPKLWDINNESCQGLMPHGWQLCWYPGPRISLLCCDPRSGLGSLVGSLVSQIIKWLANLFQNKFSKEPRWLEHRSLLRWVLLNCLFSFTYIQYRQLQFGFWQNNPIYLSLGGLVIFLANGGTLSELELGVLYIIYGLPLSVEQSLDT